MEALKRTKGDVAARMIVAVMSHLKIIKVREMVVLLHKQRNLKKTAFR